MDEGELRVVIGPNGAGKTTFMDVITGKTKPTEGRVFFKGKNLRPYSEYEIARLGIGRKFQTPRVYLKLTPARTWSFPAHRIRMSLALCGAKRLLLNGAPFMDCWRRSVSPPKPTFPQNSCLTAKSNAWKLVCWSLSRPTCC